jgi:hypothetical protein
MQTGSKRWIMFLLIGAALSVAWLVWHALHTIPALDMRAEAARADAVIYGLVGEAAGHRQVVVEEIWKSSSTSEAGLRVGSAIAVPQLPRDAHPERLVVFLERSSRDGKLHAGTIVAVNHGRLGWGPELSVEEARAICAAPQASNHAMERTGTRRAFTLALAATLSLQATRAFGARRSSCSR